MPARPAPRPEHVAPFLLTALDVEVLTGLDGRPGELPDVRVTGVTHDSRQVRPGDLYLALPGAVTHGARFAATAAAAGAAAVMTDPDGAATAAGQDIGGIPVIVVADPRAHLGTVAAQIYGHPARDILMLGVTGTNGKTTVTYLIDSCLRAGGHRTGLIGTIESRIGDERIPSVRTTPEASEVHAMLALMRERGVTACAMEVSSHAMVYGRVDGIVFDVVGFTNLTQDHLDFHRDLDDYFAAKAALFTPGHARRAVVDVTGEYGRRLATGTSIPTVAIASAAGRPGEAPHWLVERNEVGVFMVGAGGQKLELDVPLPGDFNVSNAALAVAMVIEAGLDPATAVTGIAAAPGVPGRMERVHCADPSAPVALVDFAHTPDAIDNVLRALRPAGRLIVVLGAGGDRDQGKRPAMGAAAAARADVVVVTDDNPRSEDPATIRAAVLAGAASAAGTGTEIVEVAGRREAVRAGMDRAAGAGDVVVVLGKGHEQGQEIAGVVQPFDDRDVLRGELTRWTEERAR